MQTIRMYVGSNNETHELEKEKLAGIVARYVKGYTIYEALGMWNGEAEKTAILEISGAFPLLKMIDEIKREMKQEAVAYSIIPALNFV